jgi:hypothetical protein
MMTAWLISIIALSVVLVVIIITLLNDLYDEIRRK